MTKQQLENFLKDITGGHASIVKKHLHLYLPLMKRNLEITVPHVIKFRHFLERAPGDNVEPALQCLRMIAESVPDLRTQISRDMGDLLYEFQGTEGLDPG